jgi:uncharacterized membrane protein HdeD (DUF308 family)
VVEPGTEARRDHASHRHFVGTQLVALTHQGHSRRALRSYGLRLACVDAYAFVDGLTAIWVGVSSRAWGVLLFGILGVIVGIYTFFFPGVTAIALLYLIAAWALVRGIFEIVTAIQLRKEISYEWALVISGVISVIFGIVLFANPGGGALAMILVIGAFALMFGVMTIVLAFRARGLPKRLERLAQTQQ